MKSCDVEQVKKDIKDIGTINIEVYDDLSPAYVCDAVNAVKEISLGFDSLAKEMSQIRNNLQKWMQQESKKGSWNVFIPKFII